MEKETKKINRSIKIYPLFASFTGDLIDSFQTYIEDVALTISNKDEQQDIIIKIEVYRRVGTLILSAIFTLILMKYELIVIEFILLLLSIVEIFINKQLCDKLANYNKKVIE